jgi:hypothetical protein
VDDTVARRDDIASEVRINASLGGGKDEPERVGASVANKDRVARRGDAADLD